MDSFIVLFFFSYSLVLHNPLYIQLGCSVINTTFVISMYALRHSCRDNSSRKLSLSSPLCNPCCLIFFSEYNFSFSTYAPLFLFISSLLQIIKPTGFFKVIPVLLITVSLEHKTWYILGNSSIFKE